MKLGSERTPGYRAGLKRIIERSPDLQSQLGDELAQKLQNSKSKPDFEDTLKKIQHSRMHKISKPNNA